ncbi:MAG: hypothetical protein ACRETB_00190 [Steroidobacteraceae bacterium]
MEEEYSIALEEAYVAAARTRCWKCRASIDVVCLYCQRGTIDGEPYDEFSVSHITAIDEPLRRQLAPWPSLRFAFSRAVGFRYLANHCTRCGTLQGDYFLHCEPRGVFFTLKGALRGVVTLTPLTGPVRLSGDEGFEP